MISTHEGPASFPDSPYLVAQAQREPAGRHAPIVLMATDASERSDGALRVAAARAKALGATLELLTVLQAEPVLGTDSAYFGDAELLRRRTIRRTDVEEQIARVLGREMIVSLTVVDGNAAYTISRVAIERGASLIVVGLGRHLIAHRLFGDEVAAQLARVARVPVLAVRHARAGLRLRHRRAGAR